MHLSALELFSIHIAVYRYNFVIKVVIRFNIEHITIATSGANFKTKGKQARLERSMNQKCHNKY